ncbi:DUF2270 domain-containing protein [Halorubrum sp. JWXQ-INN 858]|uniref:DUF2270 domain-containing protein n=1 Tax=Halorubrum sp. JWXQ-INN 858 TaxID=2690782 RepID=UPI00135CBDBA|nr:DUF2270 domain-containing protein [Halorubrum sp. JWXQ-INN 858]MWV64002.1 DUF2270 domain-containing protein [Halorubrum sp. JWXQ-INN 858]
MDDDTDTETDDDVGDTIGQDVSELSAVLGDAYRGELDRETTWRSRLDQTTTWSVTMMAAILTWAFSSPDNPHYIVLVGVLVATLFLFIEARRYRDYDVYRSRVRVFQQNLIATTLDPAQELEHGDWREKLAADYRNPTVKITLLEAVENRLRRIYLALISVLLLAWLFRITAYTPDTGFLETASIGTLSGPFVLGIVGGFYLGLVAIVLRRTEREAKGEFEEEAIGEWKDSND